MMKSLKYFVFFVFLSINYLSAQVGVGTNAPNSSSMLDVNSTTKGVLFPRMTNSQMLAIISPVVGLQVYNTDANCMYYYDGAKWMCTLNGISKLADAGVAVQFDNLQVKVASSGNRSLQIATVSGSITVSGSSFNIYVSSNVGSTGAQGSITGNTYSSTTIGTTFSYVQSGANFLYYGSIQRFFLNDQTNNKGYRVTCIYGNGFSNNTIEIERIY